MKKSISTLIISCFTVISAQQLDVVAGQPDFSDFPNICVDVTVSDSTGNVVSGITNDMVTLFEDSVQNNSFNISSLRESGGGLSILIAVAMILNMIVAGLFGILVPVALQRMKIDPAVASSVFVTTITDVVGFLSFLGIGAYFFLN